MTPYLHERFPALGESLPHLALSERPTPVRELPGLGIWVKEDGVFGSGGWGGNKVRKLEWLIPDAKRRRRTILTFGGLGTNWGLATALTPASTVSKPRWRSSTSRSTPMCAPSSQGSTPRARASSAPARRRAPWRCCRG